MPRLALCLCLAACAFPASALAGYPLRPAAPGPGEAGEEKPEFDPDRVLPRIERALGGDVKAAPGGLYRVDVGRGPDVFTHGPDPVTPALSSGKAPAGDPFAHGKFGNEPTDPPLCAASANGDYYQHVIYMRPPTRPDRFAQVEGDIVEEIFQMNYALNRDSLASGGPSADYKVLCKQVGGQFFVDVANVVSSAPANFSGVTTELRNLGFNKQNVDYTVFYDGNPTVPQCGVGGFFSDESAGANNLNNLGNNHGITWVNCWDGTTPMHENGHNQGAVQYNAPQSTGDGAHCFQAQDIMCYNDGGDLDPGFLTACPNPAPAGELRRFDCGFDTYFDSAPENDEYLDDNWNIGSPVNRFIVFGAGGGGNQPPIAAFTHSCDNLQCQFTDQSTDADGTIATRHWNFGEGGLASSQQNPSYTYQFSGTKNVSLQVTDDDGASDSVQIPVTVSDGTSTRLANGVREARNAGAQDTFDRVKFKVPRKAKKVVIKTTGEDCDFVSEDLCIPDLDLYVRIGAQPTLSSFHCRPFRYGIKEKCIGRASQGSIRGMHHIGVYNFAAAPGTPYKIRASFKK